MTTVVHVITGLGQGGAERMLRRVVEGVAGDADLRTVVVSLMDEGVHGAAIRAAGAELHCLGMARGGLPLGAVRRLAGVIRAARPDVVMTWLYHADLLGLAAAALAGRPPVVWNLRCSEIDFANYARTTRWVVAALTRLSGRPFAVGYNAEAGRAAHRALGYRPRRWRCLPNGFDPAQWRPDASDRAAVRRDWGVDEADRVIGLFARVDPQKDHATFLAAAEQAAAQAPGLRIVLAGRGTEALAIPPALADRTRALGPRDDVERLLRGCDLVVSSSAYGEGLPNAIGEAMATGVPCIATDVGDSALLIGDTGRVVPARDPAALAAAMVDLAGRRDEERTALGAAARDRIVDGWSMTAALDAYRAVWAEAAARRG